MSTGEVTSLHEGWRYKTLTGGCEQTVVGIATHKICQVLVPFEHILRKAMFGAADITQDDTDNVITMKRAQPGGALAGETVGTSTIGVTDSSDKAAAADIVLDQSLTENVDMPAGTIYFMNAIFDHVADAYVNPAMSIMVSPIPPGPA